jgi:hypothetical protein
VLASGDPVPPVDPHELARVDVAVDDLESDPDAGDALLPRTPVPEGDGMVVAVRGPGGFPLLATALLAEPLPVPIGSTQPLPMEAPGAIDVADNASAGADLVCAATSPAAERARTKKPRRASAATGVTFALILMIALSLPDVVARFPLSSLEPRRPRFPVALIRRVLRFGRG